MGSALLTGENRLTAVPFSPKLDDQGFFCRWNPGLASVIRLSEHVSDMNIARNTPIRRQLRGCPGRTGACGLGHSQCALGCLAERQRNQRGLSLNTSIYNGNPNNNSFFLSRIMCQTLFYKLYLFNSHQFLCK